MSRFQTAPLSDKKIIAFLKQLEESFDVKKSYVTIGNVNIDHKDPKNSHLFEKRDSRIINGAVFKSSHFEVKYSRGMVINGAWQASQYADEITVTFGDGSSMPQPTAVTAAGVMELIQKTIIYTAPLTLDESVNASTQLLQQQINSLGTLYQDMLTGVDKRRAELENGYDKKLALLEEQFRNKTESAEQEEKQARIKIQELQDSIEKRSKELDDRDHRHVRRDLRANINTDIKNRLGETLVSKQASYIRWLIFAICAYGAAIFGYISYQSLNELFSLVNDSKAVLTTGTEVVIRKIQDPSLNSTAFWGLFVKSTLASIAAVGFLLYAISWLRRMYYDDVQMKTQLEKYGYDINRASWAIETIMDLSKETGNLPPQTWIEAVCNNLFQTADTKHQDEISPIAALLSNSAKVEIGPNGTKFELGKSGAKNLANEIDE